MSVLSLAVLFLLPVALFGATASDPAPTYERHDPTTGKTLICEKCEPGTHMEAHCTATTPTKCMPCRSGHYTELWNYLPRCLYCNNICTQNLEVETECSPLSNRVCRCKEGYWMKDFCIRHSKCGPGHGVQIKGTRQRDTVCEECPEGSFSNSSSAIDSCVKHRECAIGELVLLPASPLGDTVCGSSEDEALRAILSQFMSTQRNRVRQLRRVFGRIIRKSEKASCTERTTLPKEEGLLLDQITAWLSQAPVEQLRQLPKQLRDSKLTSMADKLDERLSEIRHHSRNSRSNVTAAKVEPKPTLQ
ncbi:uncharacterized protein PAE49_005086 isoform 2-T2 [Odontesthes bonariensis]|uniref:uncharacterized protein LOC142380713 isoform X2 n=1 Tax=Odontesthes bonariensis TaxID=219752 RepID=UPI003F58AA0F